MADVIYRQAAIDRFEPWLKVKGYNEGELNMLKAVLYELKCLPSAQPDVPERNVGKWIKVGDNSYRCSVCGEVSCCNGNFCPDCGAKMDGGDKNAIS